MAGSAAFGVASPASRAVLWDRTPLAAPVDVGPLLTPVILPPPLLRHIVLHVGHAAPPRRLRVEWDAAVSAFVAHGDAAGGADASAAPPATGWGPSLLVARPGCAASSGSSASAGVSTRFVFSLTPPPDALCFSAVRVRLPRVAMDPPSGVAWGFLVMDAGRRLAPLPPALPSVRSLGLPVVGCWVAGLPSGGSGRGSVVGDGGDGGGSSLPDPRVAAAVAATLAACPPPLRAVPGGSSQDAMLLYLPPATPAHLGSLFDLRLAPRCEAGGQGASLTAALRCVPRADTAEPRDGGSLGFPLACDASGGGRVISRSDGCLVWCPGASAPGHQLPSSPVAVTAAAPPRLSTALPTTPLPATPSSPRGERLRSYLSRLDAALTPALLPAAPAGSPPLPPLDDAATVNSSSFCLNASLAGGLAAALEGILGGTGSGGSGGGGGGGGGGLLGEGGTAAAPWPLSRGGFEPPAALSPLVDGTGAAAPCLPPSAAYEPWLPLPLYEQMASRDAHAPSMAGVAVDSPRSVAALATGAPRGGKPPRRSLHIPAGLEDVPLAALAVPVSPSESAAVALAAARQRSRCASWGSDGDASGGLPRARQPPRCVDADSDDDGGSSSGSSGGGGGGRAVARRVHALATAAPAAQVAGVWSVSRASPHGL